MQQLATSQANAEVIVNENFETLDALAVYGKAHATSTGLTWGYYGGRWSGIAITAGTLTLTNTATNYIVVNRLTGAATVATTTTNWLDTANYARVYALTVAGSVVTATEDHRAGLFGAHGIALPGKRFESVSAAYTCVAADAHAVKLHPSADTTARVWTIPANSSVAYPVNTELEFINQDSAGVVTIAITTDVMCLAGAGTTGSRTLAANGHAWARKVTATEWLIHGYGLT